MTGGDDLFDTTDCVNVVDTTGVNVDVVSANLRLGSQPISRLTISDDPRHLSITSHGDPFSSSTARLFSVTVAIRSADLFIEAVVTLQLFLVPSVASNESGDVDDDELLFRCFCIALGFSRSGFIGQPSPR